MDYLLAASLGGLVAGIFSLPAVLLEFTGKTTVEDAPLIVDIKTFFGRKLHDREIFFAGLFLHLMTGAAFGAVYVLFVKQDWLFVTHAPYSFLSFFVFACFSWIVAGIVLYPTLGMGLFGCREGAHVWSETLVSHLLIGVSLWLMIQWFQPVFF